MPHSPRNPFTHPSLSRRAALTAGSIGILGLGMNHLSALRTEAAPLGADGLYVIEMSSYQLDLTSSITFDVAVLTNITPDHLDRHGGMDGYIAAKEQIFRGQQRPRTAVVGVDDEPSRAVWRRLKALEASLDIRLAGEDQVLEVGIGLGVGHRPPGHRFEQPLRVVADRRLTEVGPCHPEQLEPVAMVVLDVPAPLMEVPEGQAVGGQDGPHTVEFVEPFERVEVQVERVVGLHQTGDVRRDGGQDVVPAQQRARFRVEQAQVIGGVAGRVHRDPFAPCERHPIGF